MDASLVNTALLIEQINLQANQITHDLENEIDTIEKTLLPCLSADELLLNLIDDFITCFEVQIKASIESSLDEIECELPNLAVWTDELTDKVVNKVENIVKDTLFNDGNVDGTAKEAEKTFDKLLELNKICHKLIDGGAEFKNTLLAKCDSLITQLNDIPEEIENTVKIQIDIVEATAKSALTNTFNEITDFTDVTEQIISESRQQAKTEFRQQVERPLEAVSKEVATKMAQTLKDTVQQMNLAITFDTQIKPYLPAIKIAKELVDEIQELRSML